MACRDRKPWKQPRRLGLAPEHGDVKNSSRVNGRGQSAPNGQRPYRQPCSVDNAPPAALPVPLWGLLPATALRTGAEYARVLRYPANRPRPQGRSLHPALCQWKTCGDLDPPCAAAPLALPR